MLVQAKVRVLLLIGLLASPLLAQSPPPDKSLDGKMVEEILVLGLKHVKPDLVLRQMKSKVGEAYLAANIEKDREYLDRTGFFSKVAIEGRPGASGVIVQVELKETQRYFPYPAIGVTGEQGLTYGGGLKSTNFLGSGAHLSTALRFGGATEFDVEASSYWRPQKTLWWKAEDFLRYRDNDLDDFEEESNEFEVQAGGQMTPNLRLGARFHYMSLKSDVPGITLSPTNHDRTPGVGLVAEYDTRDSWTNARNGWWSSADFLANGLGADGDYWTFDVDVRRYQRLAERHGLGFFSLLTLQTGTVGQDIPVHEDFHIGGTNSVRGWEIDARHGKNQWLNTIEYRYDLMRVRDLSIKGFNFYVGLQLAAFGDTGSAWNAGEFNRNFIGGGGLGLRLIVPYVDYVRIDFGFGQSGQGLIPHFGVMEKAVYQRRRIR